MLHATLIALHAVSGAIAFIAGCLVLRRRTGFSVYRWSLLALVLFLAAAIAIDWPTLDTLSRILFTAFVALGGYLVYRASRARRLLAATEVERYARLADHVGFTLIALFDGFVVILVLDLGAPTWLVVLVGIGAAVAGHFALRRVKTRAARTTTEPTRPQDIAAPRSRVGIG